MKDLNFLYELNLKELLGKATTLKKIMDKLLERDIKLNFKESPKKD